MDYYGISSSSDFFAHYGIKGMKWGVRKAIYDNNDRALERHYRKAARKLAKLEKIGNRPGRYAAKAAAYGAAAAGVGTLAVGGTNALANTIRAIGSVTGKYTPHNGTGIAQSIENWGNVNRSTIQHKTGHAHGQHGKQLVRKAEYKNLNMYRIGTGIATAGLAGLAAKNAYRATHGAKYRAKANEFRNAMNETFKGTKYEGLNGIPLPKKKRKRR